MLPILRQNLQKTSSFGNVQSSLLTSAVFKRSTNGNVCNIINELSFAPYSSSNIRDAGGAFGKKEKAEEERWIYEHEKEVLKNFKENVAHQQHTEQSTPHEQKEKSEENQVQVDGDHIQSVGGVNSTYGGAVRSGGGAFSKKEAAVEDKYFREHDQELLQKLKSKK